VTYVAHTQWKSEKDVAAFDRLLAQASDPDQSHGTRELLSVFGGIRAPRQEAAS